LDKKNYYRINNEIKSSELRVIDENGKMIGIMPKDEALKKSQEMGLDLVEIAPKAVPPVAKIIEIGKFRYIEEKKAREQKKKAKLAELKEVRLSPFIAGGDYQTKVGKIDKFLKKGHKVKVVVVFKGRHMDSKSSGYALMKEILANLAHPVSIDMEPKFLGRHLAMVISPLKKKQNLELSGKNIYNQGRLE